MRRFITAFACAFACVFAAAPAAQGQWDPGASAMLGQGYGQAALSQSVMSNAFGSSGTGGGSGGKGGKGKGKSAPKKPTKSQLNKLRFTPRAARTRANAAEISRVLLATCPPERTGCPVDHAGIVAAGVASGDHHVRFRSNLRTLLDGSDRNVADGVTGFLVLAWMAQRPSFDVTSAQRKGLRRTARALREQMALSAPVRRLSDARKQRLVEVLGSLAQHTLALRHAYQQLGHPEQAEKLTRYLRDVAKDLTSVDVSQLKLMRSGLTKR